MAMMENSGHCLIVKLRLKLKALPRAYTKVGCQLGNICKPSFEALLEYILMWRLEIKHKTSAIKL